MTQSGLSAISASASLVAARPIGSPLASSPASLPALSSECTHTPTRSRSGRWWMARIAIDPMPPVAHTTTRCRPLPSFLPASAGLRPNFCSEVNSSTISQWISQSVHGVRSGSTCAHRPPARRRRSLYPRCDRHVRLGGIPWRDRGGAVRASRGRGQPPALADRAGLGDRGQNRASADHAGRGGAAVLGSGPAGRGHERAGHHQQRPGVIRVRRRPSPARSTTTSASTCDSRGRLADEKLALLRQLLNGRRR